MGRTVDDVIIGFKTLLHPQAHRYDESIPPTVFNQDLFDSGYKAKITIGIVRQLD